MRPGIPLKYNLRHLRVRPMSTLLTATGLGLVVFALAWVLALAEGLRASLAQAASPENALVLRGTATSESSSSLSREAARLIGDLPQVARGAGGEPLACPQVLVQAQMPHRRGRKANVILRGVEAQGMAVHDRVRIVRGRAPRPGAAECMAGIALERSLQGLSLGATLKLGRAPWRLVGIFEAGGSALESELWTDARTLMDDFQRDFYSSVSVKLRNPGDQAALARAVENDPRIALKAWSEEDYYADQAESAALTRRVGLVAALLMGMGAVLGAMNTMVAAVAGRTREVATLMALGFRSRDVLLSFLVEALLLGLLGGLIGLVPALFFHGSSASFMNFRSFTEVEFTLAVTPRVFLESLLFALAMGLAGGLWPALRASRLAPARALREP